MIDDFDYRHDSIELDRETRVERVGAPDRPLDDLLAEALDCLDGCPGRMRGGVCDRCGLDLPTQTAANEFAARPERYQVSYGMRDGHSYDHTKHRTLSAAEAVLDAEMDAQAGYSLSRAFFITDLDDPERGNVYGADDDDEGGPA